MDRASVPLVRAGLHHLDIVRSEPVPEELATTIRGDEEVELVVRAAALRDERIQLREDPLVRGEQLARRGRRGRGEEPREASHVRREVFRAPALVLLKL